MDTEMYLLLIAFGIMFCGVLLLLVLNLVHTSARNTGRISFVFSAVALVIILGVCSKILISGKTISANFPALSISILHASLHLSVDRLSAFFMILVAVLSLPVAMFSISYMAREKDIRGYYAPLTLFMMGMLGVLCVDDFFFFFIPWEFMSLSAYALILFEKDNPQALQAGLKYFVVTHFGNICMFIGAIIFYFNLPAGEASFAFASISKSMALMAESRPALLNLSLALFFIGFATKAGVFPFGFLWLPDAHPAAPSPVSSLLSGVMIKIGVYGLIRTFLFLMPLGAFTVGWGWTIAIFGTLSLFLGTLRAMMQHDSKVLLAYHSIGQIGYILLGLGLGMAFLQKSPLIALVGLIASLYHLMNHTCFKGLLFLNAGAVIHKTGVRDMDKLGGLSRVLPVTSVTALIAVLSIGGLPGFSGFVSKWMLYQTSLFSGMQCPWAILMGITAIFISVVTIVSVLKFYACQFLGKTPTHLGELAGPEEIPIRMSQIFLAVLCIVLGMVPILGILPGFAIFAELPAFNSPAFNVVFGEIDFFKITLHAETAAGVSTIGVWDPALTMAVFVALAFFGYGIMRSGGAPKKAVENWYCGTAVPADEMIYPSSGYYQYLKHYFDLINTRFIPANFQIKTDVSKIFDLDKWLYYPVSRSVVSFSKLIAKSHVGIPHVYLLWTIIGAVLTIAVLFYLA